VASALELRKKLVAWIKDRLRYGEKSWLANILGVTMRTLQNWCQILTDGQDAPRPGRPAHGKKARMLALCATCRELRRQGYSTGARTIWESLDRRVPLRLVRWAAKQLKARKRKRLLAHRARTRIHLQVELRDVLWAMDGTHLGRDGRTYIEGQVAKDVATLRMVGVQVGPAATGEDLVDFLEDAKEEHGSLPLVLCTDNGSANTCDVLARYLADERIVHLKTCVHTPQHNGWVERTNRELKEDSGLGKGVQTNVALATDTLAESRRRLDEKRRRPSRGFKTAVECDLTMPGWYDAVSRDDFYEAACCAIEHATQGPGTAREKRVREREAIFATMERFGLIKRTRGGEPLEATKHEVVS
jgi:hypothetical protein